MKFLTIGIYLLLASACVSEPISTKPHVSAETHVQQLKDKIHEIELECVPQKGTPRSEVEMIFGKGRPLHKEISKLPIDRPIPLDSPNRGYILCSEGRLYVRYDSGWNVEYAFYKNPHMANGRFNPPTDQELIQELEPRLKQMEEILKEYRLKKDQKHEISQP